MDSVREQCAKRWEALKRERASWMAHWREISEVLIPRTGRFLTSDNNRGDKRHNNILDNSGTRALRTLAGGMMAGMTSPSRPWFRLTTTNPDLDESEDVKQWLTAVTNVMQQVFSQSNTYRALQMAYEELGAYGTSSTILLDDYENIIHCLPLTIGEYALATDSRGDIDTCYREFRMAVSSVVEEFGYENCSQHVKRMYDRGKYDEWVTVINAIEPRRERNPNKRDSKNMPWRSVYFEERSDSKTKLLRESGFKNYPALSARWHVTGGDIYGTSPGMEALGDLRQLQQEQYMKAKAISQLADPAVVAPIDFRNQEANLVPGGIVYADNVGQVQAIRSAYEVQLNLEHLLRDIQDVRDRIDSAFYKDIFMMIAQSANARMTATEVAQRQEEKMLMLGPVLERLNAEIGSRLVKLTFDRMLEVGIVPPVPEELNGIELTVEFMSILAQAQRAVATNAVDRFTQNLGVLISVKPELADKFNADAWADYYADKLGIDPSLIVSNDQVAVIREQRAQQQAQQQQLDQGEQAAGIASQLANAQALDGGLAQQTSPFTI